MNRNDKTPRSAIQLIWGIALVAAGVGVLVRVSQEMPRLAQWGTPGIIRFAFYIMAIILIGGGIKKVAAYFRPSRPNSSPPPSDEADRSNDAGGKSC